MMGGKRPPRLRLTGEPSEDQLHRSVADLLWKVVPEDLVEWTHFPAGGYELSRAAAVRMYRYGLKPGIPDFLFWYEVQGYHRCLGIELKNRFGVVSRKQRDKHEKLRRVGMTVEVCRSAPEVLATLRMYGVPMLEARIAA